MNFSHYITLHCVAVRGMQTQSPVDLRRGVAISVDVYLGWLAGR
jgi:hypothetical protein